MGILFDKNLEINTVFSCCEKNATSNFFLATLTQDHFSYPPAKMAYHRILNLVSNTGSSVDWVVLCSDPTIDKIYRDILVKWDPDLISADDSQQSYAILEEYRVARLLNQMCEVTQSKLSGTFDAQKLLEQWGEVLSNASVGGAEQIFHFGDSNNVNGVINGILDGEKRKVVKTGFSGFDEKTGGLPVKSLLILGAGTGGGKSTMAMQIGLNMWKQLLNVAVVTLEIDENLYLSRVMSNLSKVLFDKVYRSSMDEDEKATLINTYNEFKRWGKKNNCKFSMYPPTKDLSTSQMFMQLKPYKYNVVIIDYIGLLGGMDGDDQWKKMLSAVRECKRFSEINNCIVIVLAQVDENLQSRYSKNIKDHCDNAWFWNITEENRQLGEFVVHQVKGRNSPPFDFPVCVDFTTMSIWSKSNGSSNLDKERYHDLDDLVEKDPINSLICDFEM